MKVKSQASIEIKASPETVFDFATNLSNLPKVFQGLGPIPAISKAEIVGGGEMAQGVTRRITNSDNSVIDEEIIAFDRPTRQAYKLVRGFQPPFSWLVRSGGGNWTFKPSENQPNSTLVIWDFYFELTSIFAYPIMVFITSQIFQKAQQLCLQKIKNNIEL